MWIVDQSDTTADGGGTLYIYDGAKLAGKNAAAAQPEVIDLGGATSGLCLAQTGTAPRRPHMLMLNESQTHAILAFVATGHVVFYDAATHAPLACIDVGVQAHAAFPSPDESYVVVANQNGKLLQRIWTNYATDTFGLDGAGTTLNLAAGTTPSGALREHPVLRPDNAPICPVIDSTSRFTFVTLRGGGMFVVDSTATPMAIVAEYVVNEIDLVGSVSSDPAPDLMGIAPSGNRVYASLRGPNPLTANVPVVNNAVGATPGLGVIRVTEGGRAGVLQGRAPITHVVGGVERADPHGVAVRKA